MTFNEYLDIHGYTPENTTPFEHTMLKDAYNAGFEEAGGNAYKELLRENEQLKQQIEKMKRCYNCKFNLKFVDIPCDDCDNYSKWELVE